jgi:hypothetical protein
MITELVGAAQSVQALATLLKSANQLSNYNEIVLAVSEVNMKLMQANAVALQAQEQQAALQAKLRELEAQVEDTQVWKEVAEELEALQVSAGVFAYVYKQRSEPFRSEKKFCTNCALQRHLSLLQETREPSRQIGLLCPRCNTKLVFYSYADAA